MKFTVLLENTTAAPDLEAEHGLSIYIETKKNKILFDTGASDAFAKNARKLHIDLSKVDVVVLSHGHNDHSGGLATFLSQNTAAPVWLQQRALGEQHNAAGDYIGIDRSLHSAKSFRFAGDETPIGEGMTLFSGNAWQKNVPIDSAGLTVLENGKFVPDVFLHEQYLLIEEDGKRVLFSGCSHKGILNIARWFRPDVLVGGFHYMRVSPEDPMLLHAAQELASYNTVYYTGHCTGQEQFNVMKAAMGDRLHSLCTGMCVQL